jgi:hypothetical protein
MKTDSQARPSMSKRSEIARGGTSLRVRTWDYEKTSSELPVEERYVFDSVSGGSGASEGRSSRAMKWSDRSKNQLAGAG